MKGTGSSAAARAGGLLTRLVARYYLGKPELDELIGIKYPDAASLWRAARNEIAYRLRLETSHRLLQLNVETTNRCNLACVMCPVNNGMAREKLDLEFDAFRRIIDENPDLEMLLMFQWGEALLVRDFFERVRYAVDRGIRVLVTSNGTILNDEIAGRILDSGLERITFSVDGAPETHERIRGYPYARFRENVERLVRLRDERGAPLRIDANMTIWQENEEDARAVEEDWRRLVDRVQFIPRFAEGPRTTPCRELWRGAMVVLSNGDVVPCCRDAEGELVVGNVAEAPASEIFNGEAMRALRRQHRRGEFPPLCAGCSEYATDLVNPRFS
ncbi:MAG: radical SAM/SPASM domain-containing protein [Planctomycetota bacterium]